MAGGEQNKGNLASICIRNTQTYFLYFNILIFLTSARLHRVSLWLFQSQLHLNEAVSVGIIKLLFPSSLDHAINSSLLLSMCIKNLSNTASNTRTCDPSLNVRGFWSFNTQWIIHTYSWQLHHEDLWGLLSVTLMGMAQELSSCRIWNMNPTTHYVETAGKKWSKFGAHLEMVGRVG